MTPAARLSAAIGILDTILAGEPAERALTRWSRSSRFAGSSDRAAVRDIVFDCLRQRRSLGWRGGGDTGRALALAYAAETGALALFTGEGYAPHPPSEAEGAALARDLEGAPEAVRLDIPDFLERELRASLGGAFAPVLEAMRWRAPVYLRVNTLRGFPEDAAAALARDGIAVEPHPLAPHALRVVENARALAQTQAYRTGLVELQDVSSQFAAAFAGAKEGMTVLDYCAGGGGKALALAAEMANRGRLLVHDANPGRMKDLPARARRAGARVEIVAPEARAGIGPGCDLVFVDAPCSGSGAWRRTPEGKWRIDPAAIPRFAALQEAILDEAAGYVRAGGTLVYATCSLLRRENEDQIDAFLARRRGWERGPARRLGPLDGGDGFFVARLTRPG